MTETVTSRPSRTEPATVLVVEDDADVRSTLADHLKAQRYRVVTAPSAEVALEVLDGARVDLILTDVHMGAMSGVELCARLKADPRFRLIPVILLTARSDLDARVAGLAAGADDFFGKPCDFSELRTRVAALLRLKFLLDQLEQAEHVLTMLGMTIEARDPYTGGHCERLAAYAVSLGRALGVDERTLKALRLGGFLHDLGKVALPDSILLKPGPLDTGEQTRMRTHPVVGADLIRSLRTLDDVRPIVRYHHERLDGSGYPEGLAGEAIPLGARIMAVVDVYDALRSERPYKAPLPHARVAEILGQESDAGYWDPRIVKTFIEVLRDVG